MTLIKEDAIQKKLTMNANNKRYYSEEYIKGWEDGVRDQYNATMPTNDNWIPVSERLPIPPTFCLVTTDGSHGDVIDIALYMSDGWHKASEVLAWMPLPTPYKGGDTE